MNKQIPYLSKEAGITTLMVDETPFLALAGEVHNSSCSNLDYAKKHIFELVKGTKINTLLLPICWELIEPKEGVYDDTSIKSMIDLAREYHLHIIFLWFGLWKNGLSTYIPAWMKLDRKRFFFAKDQTGKALYSISPFCKEAIEKDAAAFQKCMSIIQEYDENNHTVIMVQVENEMGLLESDLDYGAVDASVLEYPLPKELCDHITTQNTSWRSVYGECAEDRYMAYAYAKAVNEIARKGKEVYPLPMYVNAWLKKTNERAGTFPSGGPHQENIHIYKRIAPAIDLCAPDCYVEECKDIFKQYGQQEVLCIPETRQDPRVISMMMYALGLCPTICISPFGIEDILWNGTQDEKQESVYDLLGIEKTAFQPAGTKPLLEQFYHDIKNLDMKLLQWHREHKITACYQEANTTHEIITIHDLQFHIHYLTKDGSEKGAAWIIEENDEYYVYLRECALMLEPTCHKEILELEEGTFKHNIWHRGRILNGDERYQIFATKQPRFFRLSLFSMQ